MCNFKSAIVLRDEGSKDGFKLLKSPWTEHHSELESSFNLHEGMRLNYAKVEFSPPSMSEAHKPKAYKLNIDEDRTPEWFTKEMQENVSERLRNYIKTIIVSSDACFLIGGEVILAPGAKVESVKAVIIHAMLDSSTVEKMLDSSTVKEMLGSSTVEKMLGSSTVEKMWGSSTVEKMLDSSTVKKMLGSSTVKEMLGSSTVEKMLDSSTVKKMWDSSTVKKMWDSSTVKEMWGSSTVEKMWGSSTVEKMLGSSTVKKMWDSSTVKKMISKLAKIPNERK